MAGVAKPRNLKEAALVEQRLEKQYPQMSTKAWKKRIKKARKKGDKSKRTKRIEGQLAQAGLTGAEMKRLRGG